MDQLEMRHSRRDKGIGVLGGRRGWESCFQDEGGPVGGPDLTNRV